MIPGFKEKVRVAKQFNSPMTCYWDFNGQRFIWLSEEVEFTNIRKVLTVFPDKPTIWYLDTHFGLDWVPDDYFRYEAISREVHQGIYDLTNTLSSFVEIGRYVN